MNGYDAFARYYDALTENAAYAQRARYLQSLFTRFGVQSGACVLDLGCGTAKLTAMLAETGYDMIGVDASAQMLSEARQNIAAARQEVLLLCQAAEELDLYGTVDAAVSTLDVINHLDGADAVQQAFYNVGLFMNPGGLFVFDVNTVYKHRTVLAENTFVYETDDVFCVWQNTLNEDDSVDILLDFFECEGETYRRVSEDFTEYAYPLETLTQWLREAQFEVLDVFDDLTVSPVKADSQRAVFAARYTGKRQERHG